MIFIRFLLFDVKWIKMIRLLTSWIVLSGFFDDIFKNRSCAWQNLPVFLSNFFLCSLTPPIRSLRKFSNGTTICSWACANWNWNSMDIWVRDLNGFNKIIILGWFEWFEWKYWRTFWRVFCRVFRRLFWRVLWRVFWWKFE